MAPGAKDTDGWSILTVSGQLFSCVKRAASGPSIKALFNTRFNVPLLVTFMNFFRLPSISAMIVNVGITDISGAIAVAFIGTVTSPALDWIKSSAVLMPAITGLN